MGSVVSRLQEVFGLTGSQWLLQNLADASHHSWKPLERRRQRGEDADVPPGQEQTRGEMKSLEIKKERLELQEFDSHTNYLRWLFMHKRLNCLYFLGKRQRNSETRISCFLPLWRGHLHPWLYLLWYVDLSYCTWDFGLTSYDVYDLLPSYAAYAFLIKAIHFLISFVS